jgi:hypothetical protein
MRTTLTIDDDLMRRIKTKADQAGMSLKEAVNIALRHGLSALHTHKPAAYSCREYSLGYPPRMDLDRALDTAAALEDEEVTRKLELRK